MTGSPLIATTSRRMMGNIPDRFNRSEPKVSFRHPIGEIGRRRWRLEAGQHQQARAEKPFYRYKKRFGARLSARTEEAQRKEVLTACNILNKMPALGMPATRAIRG